MVRPLRQLAATTAPGCGARQRRRLSTIRRAKAKGKIKSFPTRNEPGEGERLVGRAAHQGQQARGIDHRIDGDRHERGAGTHAGAGAASGGRYAGVGVPAGRGRRGAISLVGTGAASLRLQATGPRRQGGGAGLPAAPERLQPRAAHATGFALDGGLAAGEELPPPAVHVCAALHGRRRGAAGRGRPCHGHAVGACHGLRIASPARRVQGRSFRAAGRTGRSPGASSACTGRRTR